MGRTREAALNGAVRAVAKYGSRKATMADIAMIAGVAKATLYNHFRTRDDVYQAAISAEVDAIAAAALARAPQGIDAMLDEAARLVAEHPAVRRVAADEPAVAARLGAVALDGAWAGVRAQVVSALGAAGLPESSAAVDLVVRYLASQVLSPSGAEQRRAAASLLAVALTSPVQA